MTTSSWRLTVQFKSCCDPEKDKRMLLSLRVDRHDGLNNHGDNHRDDDTDNDNNSDNSLNMDEHENDYDVDNI